MSHTHARTSQDEYSREERDGEDRKKGRGEGREDLIPFGSLCHFNKSRKLA